MAADLDNAALPDHPETLRALLAERDAALAGRDALLLNARFEIEKLRIQLAALRRERYGKSAERLAAEIGQLERRIGELEADQAEREAAAAEKTSRTRGKSDKPRQPALRRPLPEPLPRETVVHAPVLACRCGCTDPARLTRLGRFWVYAFDPRPWGGTGPPAALYCCSPDRKGERPREQLAGQVGWLHADACAGYDALTAAKGGKPPQITHAACMAHARRELFKVHETTRSPIAEAALRRIGQLYATEAAINGQSAEQRRAARQAQSKPPLEALHAWMLQPRRRLSGKSTLGKALQYALNRWDALACYVADGRLSIDNNRAERLLRGIAVTRKNLLFVGSDSGGQRAAIIPTIAETAKLNGLAPEACIAAILDHLAHGHPMSRLDELLPWNFQAQRQAV